MPKINEKDFREMFLEGYGYDSISKYFNLSINKVKAYKKTVSFTDEELLTRSKAREVRIEERLKRNEEFRRAQAKKQHEQDCKEKYRLTYGHDDTWDGASYDTVAVEKYNKESKRWETIFESSNIGQNRDYTAEEEQQAIKLLESLKHK